MKLHNAIKKYLVLILFFVAYTYNLQATPFLEQQWITTTNYSWNTGDNCRDMDFYNNKLYVIDKGNKKIHVINASTGAEITGEVISSSYFTGFCICIDGNGNKLVTEGAYGMTNSFKASKIIGTTVTEITSGTASSMGGRIDYLDIYGNLNSGSGYIVGASVNTSDQISVYTFTNGTISNMATPIAFTNKRGSYATNSDICIVDENSFWVTGAGITPLFVTMNSEKTSVTTQTLNISCPLGGLAYFELNSHKYVVIPSNTTGSISVYCIDDIANPVQIGDSTATLGASGLTHRPIEVAVSATYADIYIWGVNGGAACYRFCLPPTVSASTPSNITQTSATLNASFTQGTKTITARGFRYGTTSGSYGTTVSGTVSSSTFYADISSLSANTTYYFQAYVTTADGTIYSTESSFTTTATPPTVTTNAATNVATASAKLNASFTQGSKTITARGFKYGTTSGTLNNDITGTVNSSTFYATLSGLTAKTTYYFKAYVTTEDGTVNATNEQSFTTLASDSVILSDESKTIPDNFEGNIIMYHGGQVANPSSFNFTGQIRYKRTFSTPTQWHTVCFPFDIDHVTVTEDNTEYTIKPYYSGAAANSCHFWIKTLNRDPSNPELYQRWRTPSLPASGHTIRKDTAYIIIFPDASYYADKEITFYSTTGSHTINNDTMSVATYEVTGDGLYFYSNLSLRKQTFTGTEFFRLDRTPYTGNFELHTNPVILPNECFIQASDSYKQSSPSILMNFSPEEETVYTGVPPTIFSIPLTITSHDNTICLMSEANQTIEIYSVSGIKIATYTMKNGEVRTLKLPKSVYVIRSNQNDKPLKIIL